MSLRGYHRCSYAVEMGRGRGGRGNSQTMNIIQGLYSTSYPYYPRGEIHSLHSTVEQWEPNQLSLLHYTTSCRIQRRMLVQTTRDNTILHTAGAVWFKHLDPSNALAISLLPDPSTALWGQTEHHWRKSPLVYLSENTLAEKLRAFIPQMVSFFYFLQWMLWTKCLYIMIVHQHQHQYYIWSCMQSVWNILYTSESLISVSSLSMKH